MTEITLPQTPYARSMTWRLVTPTQVNVSGWTGERQVLNQGRGWWECRYELPPIVGETSQRDWRSFVAKAQGTTNTFKTYFTNSDQTALTATARVNGGSQTGRSLITDGWPNSTDVLVAGQHITVGDQLLRLTADATTNGSGQVTLSFEPPLRASPADNAIITYNRPYALMYLQEEPEEGFGLGGVYTLSLSLREAF